MKAGETDSLSLSLSPNTTTHLTHLLINKIWESFFIVCCFLSSRFLVFLLVCQNVTTLSVHYYSHTSVSSCLHQLLAAACSSVRRSVNGRISRERKIGEKLGEYKSADNQKKKWDRHQIGSIYTLVRSFCYNSATDDWLMTVYSTDETAASVGSERKREEAM